MVSFRDTLLILIISVFVIDEEKDVNAKDLLFREGRSLTGGHLGCGW